MKGNTKKAPVEAPKEPDYKVEIPANTLQRWQQEDQRVQQMIQSHNANRQNDIRTLCESANAPADADAQVQPDGKFIYVFSKS